MIDFYDNLETTASEIEVRVRPLAEANGCSFARVGSMFTIFFRKTQHLVIFKRCLAVTLMLLVVSIGRPLKMVSIFHPLNMRLFFYRQQFSRMKSTF